MERSGSVVHVECLSRGRDIAGVSLTGVTAFSLVLFQENVHSSAKEYSISSLLTCLRRVHFRGMTVGFVSCHWTCIALNSVSTWVYCIIEIYMPARMMPEYCLTKSYFVVLSLSKTVNRSMY